MEKRSWIIFIVLIILFLIVLIGYKSCIESDAIAPLNPSLRMLGVIDMDKNHGIDIEGLKRGDDILLVLDRNGFNRVFVPAHPELSDAYSKPFDLQYYGGFDGLIDNESPIWPYLYVVVYGDNGKAYQVKHLSDAGIHEITSHHLTPKGDHTVLLTDGDSRILYEVAP